MLPSSPDDVLRALRDFVARIDQLDPGAPVIGELPVGPETLPLRLPVARALVEALLSYHDPRDHGVCPHCRTGRLDGNFHCRSCGIVNGVFGQLLAEHALREQPLRERALREPDRP
jgi:hypothetical protein